MSLFEITPDCNTAIDTEALTLDGDFFGNTIKSLDYKYNEDKFEAIKTAIKAVKHCVNHHKATGFFKSILCLGKVQAGKSSFMQLSIALGFDNGIDIAVVFAADKLSVLDQYNSRTEDCFDVSYIGNIFLLSTVNSVENLDKDKLLTALRNRKKIIITIIKNNAHIKKLAKILCSKEFRNLKIVVFDDEFDVCTFGYKKGKKTPTYREITNLLQGLSFCTYYCVTATPQSALLLQKFDDLRPTDTILIKQGHDYTGGSTFHGADQHKFMRDIPIEDMNFDDPTIDECPLSFWKALSDFFVGAAHLTFMGECTGQTQNLHSMMVHTSGLKRHHSNVEKKIKKLTAFFQESFENGVQPDSKIYNLLKESYDIMVAKFPGNYPTFSTLLLLVGKEVNNLEIHVVNSNPKKSSSYTTKKYSYKNNIFVGGNLLGRALTIPNLAVTYIYRSAKTTLADTTEQRARWFGYKKSYLSTCRIYAPLELQVIFSELLGHEDDLWAQLDGLQKQNITLNDWTVRHFLLKKPITLTGKSVGNPRRQRAATWKNFAIPKSSISENLMQRLFMEHPDQRLDTFGKKEHKVVSLGIGELYHILQKSTSHFHPFHNISLIIKDLMDLEPTLEIEGLLMDNGKERERKMSAKGEVRLHQGKTDKLSTSNPNNYCGDKALAKGKVQLQFSNLIIKNQNRENYLGIALYLPASLRKILTERIKNCV
jgi:hypothetical protein